MTRYVNGNQAAQALHAVSAEDAMPQFVNYVTIPSRADRVKRKKNELM